MNERIKELAKQAGLIAPYGSDHEGLRDFDYRKFAELIVKECSQFIEDKFDFCGDELIIAEQILKHFGVEE